MKFTRTCVAWKSFALFGALVFAALAFSSTASAALAVDSTSNASSAGAVNSLSWVHTTNTSTTGQNTLLVVGVSINGTSTVSSVTMGATLGSIGSSIPSDDLPSNLTLATSKNSTNNLTRMEIWYLLAPPVKGTTAGASGSEPTLQITVTLSGGATKSMVAGAVFFTGAMQVAPTAWTATTAATGNASITGTSNATDIVVDTIATIGTATSVTVDGARPLGGTSRRADRHERDRRRIDEGERNVHVVDDRDRRTTGRWALSSCRPRQTPVSRHPHQHGRPLRHRLEQSGEPGRTSRRSAFT